MADTPSAFDYPTIPVIGGGPLILLRTTLDAEGPGRILGRTSAVEVDASLHPKEGRRRSSVAYEDLGT